jgi:hypothetical protein
MILKSRERKYLQHVMKLQGYQDHYNLDRRLHLPPYTEEQFMEVSVKVLPIARKSVVVSGHKIRTSVYTYLAYGAF